MRFRSLRLRLVAGGIMAILVALSIAGAGLIVLFERHLSRTMVDDLDVHLKQLIAGLDIDQEGNLVVTRAPADPRFAELLSGLYWQVTDDRDQYLRSRSLWDAILQLPIDAPAPGEVHRHETWGPANAHVLIAERRILLTIGDRRVPVRVAVATDLTRVSTAGFAFAKDLAIALVLLGLVLALATSIQVGLGLRPLAALRRGVADIRSGHQHHLPHEVPSEVRPLVEEVNALLEAQEREMERSRSRAADLAHGLKTPLVALAADAARLREQGEQAIAQDIEAIGDAMSRYVDRELARARVRGAVKHRDGYSTALAPLARALVATLSRTPSAMRVSFEPHIADDVQVPIDRTDLAEVLGNLLENAARHAAQRVRISASSGASIVIEDDGPGIPSAQWPRVLERGTRLDERGNGAGLGLAIVQDVLHAYGWSLDLAKSDLGGLKVTIALPITEQTAASVC
jgi:signal transduction histidine kinase